MFRHLRSTIIRKLLIVLALVLAYPSYAQEQPTLVFSLTLEAENALHGQMEEARNAMRAKDYDKAILIFNSVLLLPQNKLTQEAQARVGTAYELSDKHPKAMAEYKAYIAMYPNSGILESIRRRLLVLEVAAPSRELGPPKESGPRVVSDSKVDAYASIYHISTNGYTSKVANFGVNAVFRENEYTTKITFKDTFNKEHRVNTANIHLTDTYRDWEVNLGRQGPEHGVLSKFDGATATFSYNRDIDYTLLLGQPYSRGMEYKRFMYGGYVQSRLDKESTLTVFYNTQFVEGLQERMAVGTDYRYFKNLVSITVSAEYDIAYKQLNSTTIQRQFNGDEERTFIYLDRRRSPVLYADKLLKLGTLPNVLVSAKDDEALYKYIVDETAVATTFVLGGSKKFNGWVLGSDLQSFHITGTASDPYASSSYSITFNAFNSELVKNHAFNSILSYTSSDYSLTTLTLTDSTQISGVRLDSTIRLTKDSSLFSLSTYYKVSKAASTEVQLMLSRVMESLDKTLVVGFKYDF